MTGLAILFVLCVILSFFFSGSEMAFVSGNRAHLRKLAEAGNVSARIISKLYKRPQHFLTTVLIGNNVVNITATAVLTYVMSVHYGVSSEWLVTAMMTPLLLVIGEVVPKDYCRLRAHSFLLTFARVLDLVSRLFSLVTFPILKVVGFFLAPWGVTADKHILVNEKEFRSLIEESAQSGVVSTDEKKMIDTILDFEKIRVENVMVPIKKISVIDIHAKVEDVKKIAAKTRTRMVLVYEEIPSIVVGMVYVFDVLFEESEECSLKKFLRSPLFIPKNTSIEKAFLMLQEKRQSYALVMDRVHEVIGVVSIDNLINF